MSQKYKNRHSNKNYHIWNNSYLWRGRGRKEPGGLSYSVMLHLFGKKKESGKTYDKTWTFDKAFLILFLFCMHKILFNLKRILSCAFVLICNICPLWCSASVRSHMWIQFMFSFHLFLGQFTLKGFLYCNSSWTKNSHFILKIYLS